MPLPKRIRASDLGEFLTDQDNVDEGDTLLLCCSDPEGADNEAVQPDSQAMELMNEMARCYNLIHDGGHP